MRTEGGSLICLPYFRDFSTAMREKRSTIENFCMKATPRLQNDFIVNESEYQACVAWLAEANEETIRHPLDNPELEEQRQRIKGLVDEYVANWRRTAK